MLTVRKRVGGGFVYVNVKADEKNNLEKGDVPEVHKSQTELSHREESEDDLHCKYVPTNEDLVRYADHPILPYIQESVIGEGLVVNGPYGKKKVVYCDYTASGRSLTFIEDYIRTYVCPFYANTHSETGLNARQTSTFREEARDIIKQCVNAGKDDVVVFTGSGATSGIHKLAWALRIPNPRVAEQTCVLTSAMEHHSNMLVWKEYGTTMARIREAADGGVDLEHLETQLKFWKEKKRLLIVSMSAASNVTGITLDTEAMAKIAHKHGALAIFDYAGGGPYLKIDMCSSKKSYKDAVIISPHKFVGGPGTPGLLIAKKSIFRSHVPDRVGGGTVTFVSRDIHSYTSNIEMREEGGTPAIIESIRTGLVFQLKQAVGSNLIHSRERDLCRRVFSAWDDNQCITVLGSKDADRIPIFSFVVHHLESGRYIHHNFIATILNDVFGIQSRGGCACAGPYAHDLLGISEPVSKRIMWFVNEFPGMDPSVPARPISIMRPGFVRVNFPYFYDDETVEYVIKAVDAVATHGWKLLPQYTFNPYSGTFERRESSEEDREDIRFSLRDIDYSDTGHQHINRNPPTVGTHIPLKKMLKEGIEILKEAGHNLQATSCDASTELNRIIPQDKKRLRWFLTPKEATDILSGRTRRYYRKPFVPRDLKQNSLAAQDLKTLTSPKRGLDFDSKENTKLKRGLSHLRQARSYQNLTRLPHSESSGTHSKSPGPFDNVPLTDRPMTKALKENKDVDLFQGHLTDRSTLNRSHRRNRATLDRFQSPHRNNDRTSLQRKERSLSVDRLKNSKFLKPISANSDNKQHHPENLGSTLNSSTSGEKYGKDIETLLSESTHISSISEIGMLESVNRKRVT